MDTVRENIRKRAGRRHLAAALLCCTGLVGLLTMGAAAAARVSDVYGATVAMPSGATQPPAATFAEALGIVLVKATGLPDSGTRSVRASLFPDPAAIVQQFSVQDDGTVRVDFDPRAVRAALDRAGMPVWADDRPLVAVWLAVDLGGGQRYIVSAGSPESDGRQADEIDQLRETITATAADLGLPVVIPLMDANDLAGVSFSDLWGDFRGPVLDASSRYGAEAVLIGRARSTNPDARGIRWSLVAGGEQAAWQGNAAAGPGEAAIFLARRQATFADASGRLRLLVTGVDSLDKYGQTMKYLKSLGIIETVGVTRLAANSVEFDLVARGDAGRVAQALDSGRQLIRQSRPATMDASGPLPDLYYGWPEGQP